MSVLTRVRLTFDVLEQRDCPSSFASPLDASPLHRLPADWVAPRVAASVAEFAERASDEGQPSRILAPGAETAASHSRTFQDRTYYFGVRETP